MFYYTATGKANCEEHKPGKQERGNCKDGNENLLEAKIAKIHPHTPRQA